MCSITEENFDESRQTAGEKNWRKACYRNFLGKLVNQVGARIAQSKTKHVTVADINLVEGKHLI